MKRSGERPPLHRARKRFGQNFLNDAGIIDRIVRSIAPQADDNLVEIGPGQGALTKPLIDACPQLQVVEIDQDLVPILLAQFANVRDFKIHRVDALKFDFGTLATEKNKPLRIVGNLPYNISTPLIFHLLSFQQQVHDMHFMLQKEVVQRLAASSGDRHYGRLGIMAQYYCEVEHLFGVPPECFSPRPQVDSAIVRLTPHVQLPWVADDIAHFSKLVNSAFQQRRKTLRNTLKHYVNKEQMDTLPIDVSLRPENLAVSDYVELSNHIVHIANSKN